MASGANNLYKQKQHYNSKNDNQLGWCATKEEAAAEQQYRVDGNSIALCGGSIAAGVAGSKWQWQDQWQSFANHIDWTILIKNNFIFKITINLWWQETETGSHIRTIMQDWWQQHPGMWWQLLLCNNQWCQEKQWQQHCSSCCCAMASGEAVAAALQPAVTMHQAMSSGLARLANYIDKLKTTIINWKWQSISSNGEQRQVAASEQQWHHKQRAERCRGPWHHGSCFHVESKQWHQQKSNFNI